MFTYRYTGDLPTVFLSLVQDGRSWVPNKGDTITWPTLIGHPLLELVTDVPATKGVSEKVTAVAEPEQDDDDTAVEEAPDDVRSDS